MRIFRRQTILILITAVVVGSSFNSVGFGATNPEGLLINARSAEMSGSAAKALSLYRQCFKYAIVRDDAVLRAAALLLRSNDLNKAQSLLEDFLDDYDAFSVTARLALSQVFQKKGELDRALAEIERAESLRANNIPAMRLKALFLHESGQYEPSIAVATNVLKSDPKDEDTRYIRASSLYAQKKHREALADLLYLTGKNPLSLKALKLQAEAYYEFADYVRAKSSLDAVLKLEPQSIEVSERLADLYVKIGKLELATEYYQRCINLDAGVVGVRTKLGKIYLLKGQREKARIEFEQALVFDAGYDPAQYNYLKILLDDGRNDDAGRLLNSWFKDFPEKTWLASAYARILGLVGKQKDALRVMRRNMKASGYSVDAHVAMSELQERFGFKDDALETLRDGEERYPKEVSLKTALVAFYVRSGEGELAERKLQEIPREDPAFQVAQRYMDVGDRAIVPKAKNSALVPEVQSARTVASIEGGLKPPTQAASTVTVIRGETLAEVSYRVYGTHKRWPLLFKENHDRISDPNRIETGQVLRVPHWPRKGGL